MGPVSRLLSVFILALLAFSFSGVTGLIVAEPCSGFASQVDTEPDSACPPTCVTCGCCAQAAEPLVLAAVAISNDGVSEADATQPRVPDANPRGILHVPKISRV